MAIERIKLCEGNVTWFKRIKSTELNLIELKHIKHKHKACPKKGWLAILKNTGQIRFQECEKQYHYRFIIDPSAQCCVLYMFLNSEIVFLTLQ